MTLADHAHPAQEARAVERTLCPTFADVVQLMRNYPHHHLLRPGDMGDRDHAQGLVDKQLANAGRALPGTAVATSRAGHLLAFHGHIAAVTALALEFTTGARLPLHRLVAVGIG